MSGLFLTRRRRSASVLWSVLDRIFNTHGEQMGMMCEHCRNGMNQLKSKQTPFAPNWNVCQRRMQMESIEHDATPTPFHSLFHRIISFDLCLRRQMLRNSMQIAFCSSPSLSLRRFDSAIFKILLNYIRHKSSRAHQAKLWTPKGLFVWQMRAYSFLLVSSSLVECRVSVECVL